MLTEMIEAILQLEEGREVLVISDDILKNNNDNNKFSTLLNFNTYLEDLYTGHFDDFISLSKEFTEVYKEEIIKDLNNFKPEKSELPESMIPMPGIRAYIVIDNKGSHIKIKIPYVNLYKNGSKKLFDLANIIEKNMNRTLQQVLSEYVDGEDNIEEYELNYENKDGVLIYDSCKLFNTKNKSEEEQIRVCQFLIENKNITKVIFHKIEDLGLNLETICNKEDRTITFNILLNKKNYKIIDLRFW